MVITDLGILTPDPDSCALTLSSLHPGVTVEQARDATGWELAVAGDLGTTEPTHRRRTRRAARAGGDEGAGAMTGHQEQ